MSSKTGTLRWLEAKAPELFLAGGVLYAVLVVNQILSAYTGTSFTLASVFAWGAWILVPLGLLGLYPSLVERRPYLTRVAAALVVIPAICSAIVGVGEIIKYTGILSEPPAPLTVVPFVAIITFTVSMVLFGVTTLLEDLYPKPIGVLMLLSASVFPLLMTVLTGLPDFVGNGTILATYLGIGIVLWTAGVSDEGVEPPADPTT